jgi:hypothetical protein
LENLLALNTGRFLLLDPKMSFMDIRQREGMAYGGMPYDALVEKLEETDPALVAEVHGDDEFHDMADEYNNYVRSEIIDWAPDAPSLESDHPRRDPAYSNSLLNLRYNGNRGAYDWLPQHPELFIGFTGNDPRGAGTDPRFDVMRGHITARAANLEARMLDSDDNFEAERPWTGQSISYGMKELHRRLQNSTRVFTVSKEGRPWGRNTALDELAGLRARRIQYWNGQESLDYPSRERFFGSDYQPAGDAEAGGIRGVDRPSGFDRAPWRNTTPDADLEVQLYGQVRNQGRASVQPGAVGGGRKRVAWSDQDIDERLATNAAKGVNRQMLGATLAVAARNRKHLRTAKPDDTPGYSHEMAAMGRAPLAKDVARVYRQQVEDSERRPLGSVQDDEGGTISGAGLRPGRNPERAIRASHQTHPDTTAHLVNAAAIVRGLREGTASGRRKIANHVVAAGTMSDIFEGAAAEQGRGVRPSTDYIRTQRFAEVPLNRAAAAEGLEVQSYRSVAPVENDHRVARGYITDQTNFGASEQNESGKSQIPRFISHTGSPAVTGVSDEELFGRDDTVEGGMTGGAPTAKSVRNHVWGEEEMLEEGSSLTEIEH